MSTLTLTLPKPHPAQRRVIAEASRFNVVCCGRRWGKSIMGENRLVTPETLSHPVAWFSPTYKMLLEIWRDVERILRPIASRVSSQERRIELITGGVIEFWSLDNPDAARGRKYKRVVIDEAAMIAGLLDAWNLVIRSTLADYAGDAWFLSTPKGMNGFRTMFQWGLDPNLPEWACWQMPTAANPHILKSEIEAMRKTMPERVFSQEVLAQFLDDAGGVFRRVAEAATAAGQDNPIFGHQYVMGVDWGKYEDFTVLTVVDMDLGAAVFVDRFNQIDYAVQMGRLRALYERFRPVTVVAESNSMGDPLIEQLLREGLPVRPFQTTNATKTAVIDSLALAFERDDIKIVPDQVLIGELQAYEMERLPSGNMRYSAPSGMHDDCVMSLALAWSATGQMARPMAAPARVVQRGEIFS